MIAHYFSYAVSITLQRPPSRLIQYLSSGARKSHVDFYAAKGDIAQQLSRVVVVQRPYARLIGPHIILEVAYGGGGDSLALQARTSTNHGQTEFR